MSNNGGPAFPQQSGISADGISKIESVGGMPLRDYFAAQAIPPAISATPQCLWERIRALIGWDYWGPKPKPDFVAAQAYAIADAMLAERQKGGGA